MASHRRSGISPSQNIEEVQDQVDESDKDPIVIEDDDTATCLHPKDVNCKSQGSKMIPPAVAIEDFETLPMDEKPIVESIEVGLEKTIGNSMQDESDSTESDTNQDLHIDAEPIDNVQTESDLIEEIGDRSNPIEETEVQSNPVDQLQVHPKPVEEIEIHPKLVEEIEVQSNSNSEELIDRSTEKIKESEDPSRKTDIKDGIHSSEDRSDFDSVNHIIVDENQRTEMPVEEMVDNKEQNNTQGLVKRFLSFFGV